MTAPTPAGPLPTRQQLDEIDALLRRMLSLPSMSSEPAAPAPAPLSTTTFPPPAARELAPPAPPSEPSVNAWRAEWPQTPPPQQPQPQTQLPSVVSWGTPISPAVQHTAWSPPPASPPVQNPPPFAMPAPMPVGDVRTLPIAAPVPPISAQEKPTSLLVWFLIVLNGTFNFFTYLLGPLGAWLRGSGRQTLGVAGVVMILGAGVWALGNWYGYEWPKVPFDRLKIPR